jgi:hypothetical protein
MAKQFWVRGGIYRDTDFSDLIEGTEECYGPFPSEEEAAVEWSGRARANIDICCHRLTIESE